MPTVEIVVKHKCTLCTKSNNVVFEFDLYILDWIVYECGCFGKENRFCIITFNSN